MHMEHTADPRRSADINFIKWLHYSKLPFVTPRMGTLKPSPWRCLWNESSCRWRVWLMMSLDEWLPLSLSPTNPIRAWTQKDSVVWGLIPGGWLVRYGLFSLLLSHSAKALGVDVPGSPGSRTRLHPRHWLVRMSLVSWVPGLVTLQNVSFLV